MADFSAVVVNLGAANPITQIGDADTLLTGAGGLKPKTANTDLLLQGTGTGINSLLSDTVLGAGKDLSAAAGAGEFDFSLATGPFKTSTGAVSINGDATLAAGKDLVAAAGAGEFDFSLATGPFKTSTGAVLIGPGAVTVSGVSTFTAAGTALSVTNNVDIGGDLAVGGNLTVQGTTFSTESETVLIADNHLYLNNGYTVNTAQTGGFVTNYLPSTTATTVAGIYTAGVPATSNPTVITAGAAVFSAGDLIQFSTAAPQPNNGLFEVLSHVGTTLTIRGIGLTATVEDFTQNQFVSGASDGATITKVAVGVLRIGTDGLPETGQGSATPLVFTDLATGGTVTLQQAYVNGNTITTSAAEGNLTVTGTEDFLIEGTVDVIGSSTGQFTWETISTLSLKATSTAQISATTGLTLEDNGSFLFWIGGALTESGMSSMTFTMSGAYSITGAASSSLVTTGAASALTITAGGASTWKTSAGLLTLEGAGGMQLNGAAGTSYLTVGVTANQIQVQAGRTLSTTGTGNINLPNNASARFQIEGSSVSANVTAANLDTLTAGSSSNADALHTHTAVTALLVALPGTSGEAIAAGAPVLFNNTGGVSKVFNADANGAAPLPNAIGLNLTAVGAADLAVSVVTQGRVSVPDAQWDSVPAVGDVGKYFYNSPNVGKLTIDPSGFASGTVLLIMGTIETGGAGAVRVNVQPRQPFTLA